MPPFKQPLPLEKLALDSLVGLTVHHCDSLSIKRSLTELRRSIVVIKEYLSDRMPRALFLEFCRRFLHEFYEIEWNRIDSVERDRSEVRLNDYNSAALEILMDVQFVGLICEGDIQHYMNPHFVHRIRGLKTLDWSELQHHPLVPRALENYNLQDLTTLIYPRKCTDRDLEVIGPRCSKLEILKIQKSKNVTDKGLTALSPCSSLRIINLYGCAVSDNGINELLNVHKRLEEFSIRDGEEEWNSYDDFCSIRKKGFDLLSRPITLVCPSVKRFWLKSGPLTNRHLHAVVALFPNLAYLEFGLPFTGDLCILKNLKNLTKLCIYGSFDRLRMENLRDLLTRIGENMTELSLRSTCITQSDLRFLSKTCGNLELLRFCFKSTQLAEKLIVPTFHNLKSFQCDQDWNTGCSVELEFCEMPKLGVVMLSNFYAIFDTIESIILDNKFPNLREVRTSSYPEDDFIYDRIRQTAKNNNLDFSLKY